MIKNLFLSVFLFSSLSVYAQVDTVQVIENADEQKKIALKSVDTSDRIQQLKLFYSDQGYFDARIEFDSTVYIVETGGRYKLQELIFLDEENASKIDQQVESIDYSKELVEQRIERFYNEFIDDGYRNAELSITEFEIDAVKKLVSIQVLVKKNDSVTVSRLVFIGNRINSQNYLTKVSRISDSLLSTKENLDQLRQNLVSSELFEQVSELKIYKKEDEFIALVAVEERTINQFDGLIGYVPDANGNGQIVGDLDISLWNVLSDGNAFELMYQRLRPETSRIKLSTSQDWIANLPLSVGLDFSLYQNDTTYQTRNIGLSISYWLASNFKLNGRIYSEASNASRDTGFQLEPDGSKRGSDLGFRYSNLDKVEVPTKGIDLDIIYGVAVKDIENDSSVAFRQQRIETTIKAYVPVFDNSVIATRVNGFYVIGDEFTESDLIRFGGANSFRGYAEEQFTASELLWGDVEYRFLTDRNSYLFLFTAAGFYHRPRLYSETDNSFTQNDFLYSGGFGLSYKTAIGRLKFSYALSSTETLGNGKVHFGISTSL